MAGGMTGAAAATEDADPDPVAVMFLGDSITGAPGCWRAHVWTGLHDAGEDIEAVGPRTEDECGAAQAADGTLWDPDNAGFSGETTYGMYVRIAQDGLLADHEPDVIALLLGTNDLWRGGEAQDVLAQYTELLALMRDEHPGVSVVIGTVPPIGDQACDGCATQVDAVNAALPAWVDEATRSWSPVTLAPLAQEFDADEHTTDGVHPTAQGERVLAQAWLPVIADAVAGSRSLPLPPAAQGDEGGLLAAEGADGGQGAGASTEEDEPSSTLDGLARVALPIALVASLAVTLAAIVASRRRARRDAR